MNKKNSKDKRFHSPGRMFPADYRMSDGVYVPKNATPGEHFSYSDGDAQEEYLLSVVKNAKNRSLFSQEIARAIRDWASLYHLSPKRANLLRPFSPILRSRVLEVGAGCGAVTRFLAELGSDVVSVEASNRRAVITRERTKEFENIAIVSDRIQDFSSRELFDVVIVIGVLEYARNYIKGVANPEEALLSRLSTLLKPDGVIILAIENKLGLKYLAGAPEDHFGVPFVGINDNYTADSIVTFGQAELRQLFHCAGFREQRWYIPCPDYKLPTTILSPKILSGHHELAATLLAQSATNDPQRPADPSFSLEQAWSVIEQNELLDKLTNSFLVVAGKSPSSCAQIDRDNSLAWHYSTERHPAFTKQAQFIAREKTIVVERSRLQPVPAPEVPLECNIESELYVDGKNWWRELSSIVNKPNWSVRHVSDWARVWINALLKECKLDEFNCETFCKHVSGRYFDAAPFNLICPKDGIPCFIDQEWRLRPDVEFGFLVFRGLRGSLLRVTSSAIPVPGTSANVNILISAVLAELGVMVTKIELDRFSLLELQVQGWVQGRTAEDVSEEWIAQTWNVSMRHRAPLDRASLIQERAAAVAEGEKNVAQIAEQLSATRNESKELGRERQRLADELLAAQVSIAEGQRGREQLTAALNEAQAVATQSEARANSLAAEIEAARGVAVERGRAALQLTADLDTALAFSAGHERDIARLSGALKSEQVATEQRDREISRLTHDLDAARVFLRDSQSEVQRLSGEVDQVQKEILRAAAERERMTGEIATVSSELAVTRNLAGTLQEQADELRADATELPGARDTLAATKVALDEARGELGRGEHRIQELSRDLQAAQARLSQAETKLARLNDEVAETKRGLGEREAKAIGLERDLNVARALLTELQATIEAQARAMNGGSAAAKRNHGGFWRAIAVRLRRSSVPDTAARQWEHEVIRKSRAFDAVWYLKQYPDVAAADQDPLWHYIRHGAAEGREPHPLFDSKWYRSQAPDLAELNMTPLGHYVSVGVSKGLDPHPLFDTDWYLEQNPDVAAAHINPLYHFMKIGCANGRDPNPLFDTSWYLEKNPDVVKARDNPLLHYDIYGWKEGRDPHPDFDTDWYLKEYSDVAESKMNPLAHFVGVGVKARYQPNKASKNNPHAVIINSSIPVFQKEETEVEVIETREAGHESPKHPNPRKDQKSQPDGFLDTGCLIVSPPHTLMLAQLFAAELSQLGFLAEVTSDLSAQDRYQHLFVFCPNVFEGMKDDYIAIQMEQTTSDRWFTDAYLEKLRRARAIIDYSIDNIEYLRSIGFEFWKLYYIPMGCMLDAPSASKDADTLVKDIDVLFYGDDQCPRRKHILAEICNHVSLKVVNNLFGNDIWSLIRRSKLVVNVHYYDSALLEIPRLCESLSLGTPVVSESSIDSAEHIEFYDAVEFVRHGDVGGLVMATKRLIADNQRYNLMVESCKRFAVARQEKFIRYFRRFLLAMNMISFASMMNKAEKYIPSITSNRGLCLTLSETPKRTKSFESLNRREFELVDGLRHPTTWIGCGLSYKFFCEVAAQRDWKTLLICEDDVNFPENYNLRKAVVDEYLQLHDGEWDLFSGFMADVSEDAKIYRVEWFKGERFVWIDRAVSMVYNIYARKVIDILSQWDSTNTDAKNNTIDRYLENKRVRVVMVYPFLVEHDESQTSSVWGFQNTQYREIISRSELVMNRLLESSASNSE